MTLTFDVTVCGNSKDTKPKISSWREISCSIVIDTRWTAQRRQYSLCECQRQLVEGRWKRVCDNRRKIVMQQQQKGDVLLQVTFFSCNLRQALTTQNQARGCVWKPQWDAPMSQISIKSPTQPRRKGEKIRTMVMLLLLTTLAIMIFCRRTPKILAHVPSVFLLYVQDFEPPFIRIKKKHFVF